MLYATLKTIQEDLNCNKIMALFQAGMVEDAFKLYRSIVIDLRMAYTLLAMSATVRINYIYRDLLSRFADELNRSRFTFEHDDGSTHLSATKLELTLFTACGYGYLELVQCLVDDYHVDIHASDSDIPNKAIDDAARSGNVELVRFLLDRGASPNTYLNGHHTAFTLISAAYQGNLPMCQLLVERGANINAFNGYGLTPLVYAKMGGHQEVIDYLISVGSQLPWQIRGEPEPPPLLPSRAKTVVSHLEDYVGQCAHYGVICQDLARPDWPIKLHRFNYEIESDIAGTLVVTDGMSMVLLPIYPPRAETNPEAYRRCELYAYVFQDNNERPCENWPEDHPHHRWIAEWMLRLARIPAEHDSPIGPATIIMNDQPPKPLAEHVPYTGWLLVCYQGKDITHWKKPDDSITWLYHAIPIYTSERDYEKLYGVDALLRKFEQAGVNQQIYLHRPPAV